MSRLFRSSGSKGYLILGSTITALFVYLLYISGSTDKQGGQEAPRRSLQRTDSDGADLNVSRNFAAQLDFRKFGRDLIQPGSNKKRVFLDCGANTGSSYLLFHEYWPNAQDYHVISFEIDERLAPFYAAFTNHTAFVPLAVSSQEQTVRAALENFWLPNQRFASKWGGGTLFTFKDESSRKRNLEVINEIPSFDLAQFILKNFEEEDEVILKIDIEGAEYNVLQKMLNDDAFKLVDKFYLEFHDWQPSGWTAAQKNKLRSDMAARGVRYGSLEAEYPTWPEAFKFQPPVIPSDVRGRVVSRCGPPERSVAVAVAVGMSRKRAQRLVHTIIAHNKFKNTKVGLFVYKTFVDENAELVNAWLQTGRFVLGIRGDAPKSEAYSSRMSFTNDIDFYFLSSLRLVHRHTNQLARYYLPESSNGKLIDAASNKFHLAVISLAIMVPPSNPDSLNANVFFGKRSVEKIPPVMDYVYKSLNAHSSNIVVLDSEYHEVWLTSVYFLDFITNANIDSRFVPVDFTHC